MEAEPYHSTRRQTPSTSSQKGSVCLITRQLHNKDGMVYLHGPSSNPSQESNKLSSFTIDAYRTGASTRPLASTRPATTHRGLFQAVLFWIYKEIRIR